ncbi:pilus assembly protein [Sphingobium sp. H39-3-25]|uniref:TadE/TadG family type IV pilus assembly protein n=1 Tax=Sphingobium arseniciresistens TaxID=3030834 RepID=UPI0023B9AC17|nr:pilus assembly protein [Sphingobium arseniciresistens]
MSRGIRHAMGRLHLLGKGCARGVAATEFALVAPFLILLYVGSFQMADAISAQRKVTKTARTLADLTSQYSSITLSDADNILRTASLVMAPYASSSGSFTITQVKTDSAGISTVDWSRKFDGSNTSAGYASAKTLSLPINVGVPNTSVILAEIQYTYRPIVAPAMIGSMSFSDSIYMFPRRSASIPLNL